MLTNSPAVGGMVPRSPNPVCNRVPPMTGCRGIDPDEMASFVTSRPESAAAAAHRTVAKLVPPVLHHPDAASKTGMPTASAETSGVDWLPEHPAFAPTLPCPGNPASYERHPPPPLVHGMVPDEVSWLPPTATTFGDVAGYWVWPGESSTEAK